jgi:hypothetical protein
MRLRQPHILSLQHIRRTGKPQTSEGGMAVTKLSV